MSTDNVRSQIADFNTSVSHIMTIKAEQSSPALLLACQRKRCAF
jgi:hypothetical protein